MNRRVLGLILAIALALVGTIAIVAYVNGAEDRALEGQKVVKVLVVKDEVPAGTPAEDLGDRVELETIAAKVKAEGAVTTVTALEGKVASATLVPGEQLVKQRFIEPTAYRARGAAVEVPSGLLQTTVSLTPDRALGGLITPGTKVAVSLSFVKEGAPPRELTHMTLRKVLVTNVQLNGDVNDDSNDESDDNGGDDASQIEPGSAPDGSFLVTLALDDVDSERLVFAAEHGTIWLSNEPGDAPVGSTKVVNVENVYAG